MKATLSRREHFETTTASFDYRMDLRLGLRADGTLIAWEEDVVQEGGAYHVYGFRKPGLNVTTLPYKIPNVRLFARSVYTNRVLSGVVREISYRQLSFAREVLLSRGARETGADPLEFRRRSTISHEECPYETAVGHRIGNSGVHAAIEQAQELVGYDAAKRRARAEDLVGLGVGCAMHITSCKYDHDRPDFGTATLALSAEGTLTVRTEACDMGTGIRTTLSQIASDVTGVPLADVTVIDDDTDETSDGLGSWGSGRCRWSVVPPTRPQWRSGSDSRPSPRTDSTPTRPT